MSGLFILVLVGLTSTGAYLLGRKVLGLSGRPLGHAAGKMLEGLGLSLAFFALNLAVGVRSSWPYATLQDFLSQFTTSQTYPCLSYPAFKVLSFTGVANVAAVIDGVEVACAPAAQLVCTMSRGPFIELAEWDTPSKRALVHSFEIADQVEVFGAKSGLDVVSINLGPTRTGIPLAHWLVRYEVAPGRPTGMRDLGRAALTMRPRPTLSVGIITHNAAADLLRCLRSVRDVADEIVVGDCSSTDDSIAFAEANRRLAAEVFALAEVLPIARRHIREGGVQPPPRGLPRKPLPGRGGPGVRRAAPRRRTHRSVPVRQSGA